MMVHQTRKTLMRCLVAVSDIECTRFDRGGQDRSCECFFSLGPADIPQIHGTVAAALGFARSSITVEIKGASDNRVILVDDDRIASGGAYFTSEHANAVETLSRSFIAMTFALLARLAKHLNLEFSGLPVFLADEGSGSNGFAPVIKTAEALAAELVHAAQPGVIWPGLNANGAEDCLSSAPVSARALARVAELSTFLAAIEFMITARAVELRGAGDRLAPRLRIVLHSIREVSSKVIDNRPLGSDVETLSQLIRSGKFAWRMIHESSAMGGRHRSRVRWPAARTAAVRTEYA